MTLLGGGIAQIMSQAFRSIYEDAVLHRRTVNRDGAGGGSVTVTNETVKAQLDRATEAMRASDGFVDTDQRIIVLAHGVAPITSDAQITLGGQLWNIASVTKDPAGAAYDCHGRRA